ncbi:hypothetical protein XAP412_890030 [Xanthomonas phaseoli pv. phaseoli]|uniref:Uncharacterized protein n=1 Tax=Xanthomonas campestris pv. phaseoli TaxID=317013 RepID=A0AB38E7S1_XANCH|nr:hypothetical protein XAP6984_920030 [Xanthomonas phaseoli pv. phaseoli]SON91314.1 hypothetical protein XAP412_890030 [Xanthomonas phaseoli pv. phaseoli]SON92900.1 hypothetical protein XAP7430_910032 [Xanthomonas phaseoli pv. phaseoli]SOO29869.1 hypothetical protein XAP6164_3740002 [Xanthomonas phaseoli pv. phaseoli]
MTIPMLVRIESFKVPRTRLAAATDHHWRAYVCCQYQARSALCVQRTPSACCYHHNTPVVACRCKP